MLFLWQCCVNLVNVSRNPSPNIRWVPGVNGGNAGNVGVDAQSASIKWPLGIWGDKRIRWNANVKTVHAQNVTGQVVIILKSPQNGQLRRNCLSGKEVLVKIPNFMSFYKSSKIQTSLVSDQTSLTDKVIKVEYSLWGKQLPSDLRPGAMMIISGVSTSRTRLLLCAQMNNKFVYHLYQYSDTKAVSIELSSELAGNLRATYGLRW